ncbi:MAG: hypothetical protein JWM85_520 [Acidimicrobiaceae bacterium]|nr:hypothetical protein [Acidimicrobiaceae bacterium]
MSERLEGLGAFYCTGDEIVLDALPPGTTSVIASLASGETVVATLDGAVARFVGLEAGTWEVQACGAEGARLAEELTTVGAHQGERPVHGFATSFQDDDVEAVLAWNRALRSTVVQVYDWMERYTAPDGPEAGWADPSGRPVSFHALRALASGLHEQGAVAHAYAPVYAVGHDYAKDHPDQLMYDGDGEPVRFMDHIVLANPANVDWQRHFVAAYGGAADRIGFDGFHVDTYGYPRLAYDADGVRIDVRSAYEAFLRHLREERPDDVISFNQVNGFPAAVELPAGAGFRYCEVWAPNDELRHLEAFLERTSGRAGLLAEPERRDGVVRGTVSIYPPVWGHDTSGGPLTGVERSDALRTVVCCEAVLTLLGAGSLIFGDKAAALRDAYYPKDERLDEDEAATVVAWRRFALRCRDLFTDGEDTSWYEIGDENGAVAVEADGAPVGPEPNGGGVLARVVHAPGRVSVGVLDLTGSAAGRWSEPTSAGRVRQVTVRVLVGQPQGWTAAAAVLGADDEHFVERPTSEVPHRWGRALEVQVPVVDGWSVLRLLRK